MLNQLHVRFLKNVYELTYNYTSTEIWYEIFREPIQIIIAIILDEVQLYLQAVIEEEQSDLFSSVTGVLT